MPKKREFPSYFYGPDGKSKIFHTPADVPEGWNKDVRRLNPEFRELEQAGFEPPLNVKPGSDDWQQALEMARRGEGPGQPKKTDDTDPSSDANPSDETEDEKRARLTKELNELGVNPVSPTWKMETLEKKLEETKAAKAAAEKGSGDTE